MDNNVYFDHAASTFVYENVAEYVNVLNKDYYANASSTHIAGIEVFELVKKHKKEFADIIHTAPDSLIFTSGGAESNNFALKSAVFTSINRGGNIVITSNEHPSITNTAKYLEKFGFEVKTAKSDKSGNINVDDLVNLIDDKTLIVSTTHVCSETGAVTDIKNISGLIKRKNPATLYHVDAVQSLGKLQMNIASMPDIDLMSFSSHKIHGPKGAGALYVKLKTSMDPFISGSTSAGLRAGTINTSGICGFCMALSFMTRKREDYYTHVQSIKNYLIKTLKETFKQNILITSPIDSSPYILNISFSKVKSEVLLNALSSRNIYVSAGSACASKSGLSPTIEAMDLPRNFKHGTVRVSFSHGNTIDQATVLSDNLKELIPVLQLFTRR